MTFHHLLLPVIALLLPPILPAAVGQAPADSLFLLRGLVCDETSGEPLAGAYVLSPGGAGASTDSSGRFSIAAPVACDSLLVTYLGYRNRWVAGCAGTPLRIALRPQAETVGEVVVRSARATAPPLATQRLERLDIYLDPNARADALRAVDALPASTNPDETADISLRGRPPAATGIFLNGVPVREAVRLDQLDGAGQFSAFQTDLIRSVDIYASHPPLGYGQHGGGVVALETGDALPGRGNGAALHLAGGGLRLSRPLGERAGWTAYANYLDHRPLRALNRREFRDLEHMQGVDAGGSVVVHPGEKTRLRLYSAYLQEQYVFGLQEPTFQGPFEQDKRLFLTIANLTHDWEKVQLSWNQGWESSNATYAWGNTRHTVRQRDYFSSWQARYAGDNWVLRGGLDLRHRNDRAEGQVALYPLAMAPEHPAAPYAGALKKTIPETFLTADWQPGERLQAGAGLRWEPGAGTPAVQAHLRYQLPADHRLLLGGGSYAYWQFPGADHRQLLRQQTRQLALEYEWVKNGWILTAAAFMSHTKGGASRLAVRGAESSLTFQTGEWRAQLSFAAVRSLIETKTHRRPSDFDAAYNLRLALRCPLPGNLTLGLFGRLRQGRYFLPLTGARPSPLPGIPEPVFAAPDAGERLPGYRRLDLNLSRPFALGPGALIAYLNLTNLPDAGNIRAYRYDAAYQQRRPAYYSRRTLFFGFVYQWN